MALRDFTAEVIHDRARRTGPAEGLAEIPACLAPSMIDSSMNCFDRQDRDGKLSRLDRRKAIALAELLGDAFADAPEAELATNIRN